MSVDISYAVARPVEQVRDAVDVLAELDPSDLSDVALADEMVALRRQMDRQDAVFARLAWAAHQRGVGSIDGAASTAAFLRNAAGMREGDAKAAIECGEVTELLADTGQAWRDGEISTGATRTIITARVAGHDDELVACQSAFLDLALRGDLRSLRRAVTHFRNLALADGTDPGDRDGLHISRAYDGRTVISGELGDLAAETVVTALHAYTDPPNPENTKTTAQRTAEALVRIAKVALAHLNREDRPQAHVTLVLDWKTLTTNAVGRTDGQYTGPIHPQDVAQLLCDSTITRIITGPDSLPLDVGRSRRTVPPSMRRALVERDQGCRFPGCNRPPGWCDAHHIKPWHQNGPTHLENLILLCDHHHHVIHQPGWTLQLDANQIRVTRPNGTELPP